MSRIFNHITIVISLILISVNMIYAQDTIYVYGPGGPAPAIKEAAIAFEKISQTKIKVIFGPTPQWLDKAKQNGDIIFTGSETMATDFALLLNKVIGINDFEPLYLRPLSLLVRPGNPKKIKGIQDIISSDIKIIVVNGSGLTGAWEDMIGRTGNLNLIKKLRKNIIFYATNSAEAKKYWIDHPDVDVWIIWNIWQVANPKLADIVKIEDEYAIYRDMSVGLTSFGKNKKSAQDFVKFLNSNEGEKIFSKWGWSK